MNCLAHSTSGRFAACFVGVLLLLCSCVIGSAQRKQHKNRPNVRTKKIAPVTARGTTPDSLSRENNETDQNADLSITGTVRAKSLRFDVVPNPTVTFTGKPDRETEWDAIRHNLPRPVEPGVTYRDIGIQLKITSRFLDIERIVAEALGEIPIDEDDVRPTVPAETKTTPPKPPPLRPPTP